MRNFITLFFILTFASMFVSVGAHAQGCTPHGDVAGIIEAETPVKQRIGLGINNDGHLLELYVDPESGEWAVWAYLNTANCSRKVDSGKDWNTFEAKPTVGGRDTRL